MVHHLKIDINIDIKYDTLFGPSSCLKLFRTTEACSVCCWD